MSSKKFKVSDRGFGFIKEWDLTLVNDNEESVEVRVKMITKGGKKVINFEFGGDLMEQTEKPLTDKQKEEIIETLKEKFKDFNLPTAVWVEPFKEHSPLDVSDINDIRYSFGTVKY